MLTKISALLILISCFGKAQTSNTELYKQLLSANATWQKEPSATLEKMFAIKQDVFKNDSLAGFYYRIYANIKSNELQKDSALFYLDKSVAKLTKANSNRLLALSIMNIGNIQMGKGNNDLALEKYLEALKIAEANNYINETAMISKNVGVVFVNQNKIEQSLKYYNKSLDLYTKLRDTSGMCGVIINIGNAHYNAYDDKTALAFYNKALDLKVLKRDSADIAKITHNIGVVYIDGGDTLKGIPYLLDALKIKESNKLNNNNDLTFEYIELATIFCYIKQYDKTELFLQKAAAMAKASMSRADMAEVYRVYAIMYSQKRDFQNAYINQNLYHATKDSILNIEKLTLTDEMEAKYNLSKKDLEIANNLIQIKEQEKISERKNEILIAVTTLALLSVLVLIFYFRNKRIKIQKQNEEKATLLMLEGEQKERIRIARELHDSVGQKLTVLKMYASGTQDSNYQNMLDETITEVRSLSHKMIPEILNLGLLPAIKDLIEKINSSGKIKCELKGESIIVNAFDKDTELSLYRIIQEVLNNMLKHSGAKHIVIAFDQMQNEIQLTIEDDGVGFDTKSIYASKGMGWYNIFTRAKLILANVNVKSSDKGTSIQITIGNTSWKK